jgi:hypothetical protein
MATFVLTDAYVSVATVDMSDWITSVTISAEVDVQEDTAMGDTYRSKLGGLKDWTLDLGFNQDFAGSGPDDTIFALLGTSVAIEVRPTSAVVGATNPKYTGNVIVSEWAALDGSVGDTATNSVSWPGNGTLTRAEA